MEEETSENASKNNLCDYQKSNPRQLEAKLYNKTLNMQSGIYDAEKCVRHYHILLSSAATTSPRLHCLVDHFVCLALQYFLYKNYAILLT